MKIKLTTENRVGLSQKVLSLFADNEIDVICVEVKTGLIFIETEEVDNLMSRNLATSLMKIDGVKWVESIDAMPSVEKSLFLGSLINAIKDPVFGINNKGEVVYQNQSFKSLFEVEKKQLHIKDIFTGDTWSEKLDVAATGGLPVNIQTNVGPLLVEVQAINNPENNIHGALVVLHKHERVTTRSFAIQGSEIKSLDELISSSPKMRDVIERAQHMTNTQVPLLIYGESGVGKRTLAQGIHRAGQRKNHLFSTINCSTVSSQQVESDLFGTFTEGVSKAGLLEITNGGTIYIDSIEDMTDSCQSKLLSFLQTKSYQRIGGHKDLHSDVKIIACSAEPLHKQVDKGLFNKGLFYTLDVTNITVPPLRQRKEEIELFADYFLHLAKQQTGKPHLELSFSALNKIKSYYWPGNISQLKNTLFKACMLCNDPQIEAENIEIEGPVSIDTSLDKSSLPQAVAEFEKHFLQHWYKKYKSTRKLAMHLGVSHTTIAQKLKKHGIN